MSVKGDPCFVVEIDLDYCDLTFGVGDCTAVLGGNVVRKCYNTWNTCRKKSVYSKDKLTYRFIESRANLPKGGVYFPLLKSVSARSATVNIAGSDARLDAMGERGTCSVSFIDMPYNDRFSDKYQSERISGAAQTDEGGYNPRDRGTFWTKFKARNPNYAGRAMRIIEGNLVNGAFVADNTRHYFVSEMSGPDDRGNVTIKGKDPLSFTDNDKAVAPKTSRGQLLADMTIDATTFTMNPAGIGAEYATSGWVTIGSEIMSFTRSGDVMNVVRGQRGTQASTHNINDAVQETYSVRKVRLDAVVRDLLINYASLPEDFIPYTEWQAEFNRWAPTLVLTADICKPTGVKDLIGELAVLGVSIWWDDINQKVRLKVNRPPDTDTVFEFTDRNHLVSIKQEDRDDDRLTRVSFWTVQIDPTKALSKDNFLQQRLIVDVDAESEFNYNDTHIKTIYCRWLNHGADNLARILAKRLLNRFNNAPVIYEMTVDAKDDVSLADVVRLSSRVAADETGKQFNKLMQIIKRESGNVVKLRAQKFAFDQRYAYFCENTRPSYTASSAAQRARGAYFTETGFSDGTGPYVFS